MTLGLLSLSAGCMSKSSVASIPGTSLSGITMSQSENGASVYRGSLNSSAVTRQVMTSYSTIGTILSTVNLGRLLLRL